MSAQEFSAWLVLFKLHAEEERIRRDKAGDLAAGGDGRVYIDGQLSGAPSIDDDEDEDELD